MGKPGGAVCLRILSAAISALGSANCFLVVHRIPRATLALFLLRLLSSQPVWCVGHREVDRYCGDSDARSGIRHVRGRGDHRTVAISPRGVDCLLCAEPALSLLGALGGLA